MTRTTIRIATGTRDRLAKLKSTPLETFDELLNRLVSLVPLADDEGEYAETFRAGLLNAHADVREGRLTEHIRVRKSLGL